MTTYCNPKICPQEIAFLFKASKLTQSICGKRKEKIKKREELMS